jgi:tRNA pseudouridine55 synthase
LYEYAREGIDVERPARDVTIFELQLTDVSAEQGFPAVRIEVRCSKGTYIRTLGEDIGEALGCGAYLVSLRRTVTGDFDQSRCVSLEALEALPEGERLASLMPVQTLLTHHTRVTLDSQNAGRFLSGMRRRGAWADAKAVAVFGDEPPALLGVGHTLAGELIPERLLSPLEIQQILENMERTHGSEGNRTEETK